MFSRICKSSLTLSRSYSRHFSSKQAGNLYTWGSHPVALGYEVPKTTPKVSSPTLVDFFRNNVVKVAMGPAHTAVITTEGDLYTFGSGQHGALGHNDGEVSHVRPKLVEFFKKNGLKVADVDIGEHHTVALTDDGDVFTWGYGGKSRSYLLQLLAPSFGALGHGGNQDRHIPTPVETLRDLPPTISVSAGSFFTNALNAQHDLYSWGRGEYAVFGDGNNKNLKAPVKNESLQRMKDTEGVVFKRIKSCASQTLGLTDKGALYGWGSNEHGQLGVRAEMGIEMYETANYPSRIQFDKLKGKNIVDFDLAENTGVFLTDTNEVYWMGLKLAYEPQLLKVPDGKKVKAVGAASGSVCAITEDNEIYMKNKLLKEESENLETGVFKASTEYFRGGNILTLGGSYRNKYAIIKDL